MHLLRNQSKFLNFNDSQFCSRSILTHSMISDKDKLKIGFFGSLGLIGAIGLDQGSCVASEFDFLAEEEPKKAFYFDDANVLSRTSKDEINEKLSEINKRSGFKLVVATIRKHKFDGGEKNGLLLLVTSGKEGALVGGNAFKKALGDDLIYSVIEDNIPIFTEKEKFNEAAMSSINRIVAVLDDKNDPGAPQRASNNRKRTYKTKEETDRVKPVTGPVVITLLLIAFVVPMLQFYGYVSKD